MENLFWNNDDNTYNFLMSNIKVIKQARVAEQRIITQQFEFQPDLVSYFFYQDSNYWWVLLLYNNMKKLQDFKIGVTINIPNFQDVENLLIECAHNIKKQKDYKI
jgi:hypothetical protein